MTPATILVVDDDDAVREVLTIVLEQHGFRVLEAADGREALERAMRRRPDLILADVEMPRLGGLALRAAVARDAALQHVPVVLMSASVDKLLHPGPVLAKPFAQELLLAEISRLLGP
jgi:CheY-like chemotaxis protein